MTTAARAEASKRSWLSTLACSAVVVFRSVGAFGGREGGRARRRGRRREGESCFQKGLSVKKTFPGETAAHERRRPRAQTSPRPTAARRHARRSHARSNPPPPHPTQPLRGTATPGLLSGPAFADKCMDYISCRRVLLEQYLGASS